KAHAIRDPVELAWMAASPPLVLRVGEARVGGEAAKTPVAADLFGEAGMQREAPAGQRFERRPVAPIDCQKSSGLAARRARQSGPLDHDRLHAAAAEEIGDRSADHAAAADHHPHEDWPPNRYREHDETSNSLRLPPPLVGRACPGLDPRSPRARPREAGE